MGPVGDFLEQWILSEEWKGPRQVDQVDQAIDSLILKLLFCFLLART